MKKLIEMLMRIFGLKPKSVISEQPIEQPKPDPVIIPMPTPIPDPLPPAAEKPPIPVTPAPVTPTPAPPIVVEVALPEPPVIAPTPTPTPTLKDSPVKWGVAYKESELTKQSVITETLKQFSSLTPENGIKTGHVQKKEGEFNFSDAKALVKIAKANGSRVHGHACFIWPSQESKLPSFWHEAAKDKAKYIALLKNTVQTTISTFANDIFSWDITNEAYQDNGKLRPCYALTHMGETYPEQIAKWVLDVQPTAKVFISDYDFETASKKAVVLINYAGSLRAKGLVHGISSQMHINLKMDYKVFKKNLDLMVKNNLLVHLSELDISCKPTEEVQKAAKYKEVVTGFRTIPIENQYGITTWSRTNGGNFMNYKKVPAPYAPAIFDDNSNGGVTLSSILEVK